MEPRYSPQSIAMGHEIGVTSIQLVSAFATFCNGGILYQPRIVRGVIGADGTTLMDNSRRSPSGRSFSPELADDFRHRALAEVVRTGTGKPAALPNYQVFGKTGTAQVARAAEDGGGYEPGAYVGSFIGGAPLDQPRVVVVVSIYKPSTGKYYGSTVAAPAVREVLQETLAYMQVPPEIEPED